MPSFNVVNYSLRPNKSIQRRLVFEGIILLKVHLDLDRLVYIGLGSIWFADFHMAHKLLQIKDMISMEADEIGFRRAAFNQPFKTITVKNGHSFEILPMLLYDSVLSGRPWLVWLDYDGPLEETVVEDIRIPIENAPRNTVLLTTFSAAGRRFGKPAERPARLQALLGGVVPDDLDKELCRDEPLPATLVDLTTKFMISAAASMARPGGFISAFRLTYRDTTPMVTVGGILPAKAAVGAAKASINKSDWPGVVTEPIAAPHLTLLEVAVMQAQLPRSRRLSRKSIQRLDVDLEEEQIRSFERYYRYYPAFVQIML
jgi:hypothetical protein